MQKGKQISLLKKISMMRKLEPSNSSLKEYNIDIKLFRVLL